MVKLICFMIFFTMAKASCLLDGTCYLFYTLPYASFHFFDDDLIVSVEFDYRPGVGKTTVLREIARVLSDEFQKRVVGFAYPFLFFLVLKVLTFKVI